MHLVSLVAAYYRPWQYWRLWSIDQAQPLHNDPSRIVSSLFYSARRWCVCVDRYCRLSIKKLATCDRYSLSSVDACSQCNRLSRMCSANRDLRMKSLLKLLNDWTKLDNSSNAVRPAASGSYSLHFVKIAWMLVISTTAAHQFAHRHKRRQTPMLVLLFIVRGMSSAN